MAMTGGTAKLVKTGKSNYGKGFAIDLYVYYKSTQDTAKNQSTVSVGMYVTTPSGYDIGYWNDSGGSYVGTTSNTFNGYIPNFSGTRWLVEDKTFTVNHDDEGKATATIYWKWGVNSPWGQYVYPSGSFTITLPQIARASTITSAANATLGTATKIVWTPKSKSFYYKVKLAIGSWSTTTDALHPNTTSAYTLTTGKLPYTIANQIASNKTTGTVTATLYTYSDSACKNQVGTADTETFTVTIPNDTETKPDITVSFSPVNEGDVAWKDLYVQGISRVQADITASGRYGTNISKCYMTLDGKEYAASPLGGNGYSCISDVLKTDVSLLAAGYATDSRGFTRGSAKTISIIPYAKPTIIPHSDEQEVVCARYAGGKIDDEGTFLYIKGMLSYSKIVSDDTPHNTCSLYYRYKSYNGSYSAWTKLLDADGTSNTVEIVIDDIFLNSTISYTVQLKVEDGVGSYSTETFSVPSSSIDFNLREGGGGAAFGKYSEAENTVEVAEDWELKILGDRWVDLGLAEGLSGDSSVTYGRAESGTCSYRVENGNHVFVQANCKLTSNSVAINRDKIPAEYCPTRDVFTLCDAQGTNVVRFDVTKGGNVRIDGVYNFSSDASSSISWFDGYIDYFITP